MISIFQQEGEVVLTLGSTLKCANVQLFAVGDCSIGLDGTARGTGRATPPSHATAGTPAAAAHMNPVCTERGAQQLRTRPAPDYGNA